jgi:hypothetical protein
MGANRDTALYGTDGIWRAGPRFPVFIEGQMVTAEAPAALLPNGKVLMATSPAGIGNSVHFLEFDGTNLGDVPPTPDAPNLRAASFRLLVLPNGQVLATDGTPNVQIYQPRAPISAPFAPTISSAPTSVTQGLSYALQGTQFNGISQAEAYGDDAQAATNYPLVRITNNATGHVFYARTHGHSTMGIATGTTTVSTTFDVPAHAEPGASTLVVVVNGVASAPVSLTVFSAT